MNTESGLNRPRRPSGSLLEGSKARAAPGGIAVDDGHRRVITVNADLPFEAPSASPSPKLGCNGLQRRGKTWSEIASDQVFLVAGAGFEPATFGL
jgi:hypothetical protein